MRRPTHFCVAPSHFRRIGQAIETVGDLFAGAKRRFRRQPEADPLQPIFTCDGKGLAHRERRVDPRLHRINLLDASAVLFAGKDEDAPVRRIDASAMRRLTSKASHPQCLTALFTAPVRRMVTAAGAQGAISIFIGSMSSRQYAALT